MSSASDDLTTPLGADREARKPSAWARSPLARLPLGRIASGALMASAALIGGYLALADDPMGGEPHAVVEIRDGASPEGAAASPPQSGLALIQDLPRQGPRATAVEVERASGVDVMRPDGAADSGALIIQVPQDGSAAPSQADLAGGGLAPAPDPRLVERTRYGLLPRIGEDGATPLSVYARPAAPLVASESTRVAILVTGLGISQTGTAEAIDRLPGDVSLAFAPYGGDLDRHVARAREDGHEIFLQAPMEPFDYPASDPGPHTLTTAASADDNRDRLHWLMGRFTGYVGVVNFMGGRLTADDAAFRPILAEIGGRGLGFVDDGSSSRTRAPALAGALGLPAAQADLVLDTVPDPDRIDAALARLETLARDRGFAFATASALPMTVERIAAWAAEAERRGVRLTPVSATLAVPTGG
ncbi:divergent polysaccharide deacetylase family protein [Salinarimonas sp.]|uniref:divergent polysaccharide deacetylase family protein n=1 Tax=Salinarimonas sp. TaxID=2766526 RepID=UPI0032D9A0E5